MYSKIFSHFYDPVMGILENKILKEKRKFLLQEVKPPVLEIGAGTGANLPFYDFSPNFHLTIIEKSPYMVKQIKKKFPDRIDKIQFIIDSIENKQLISQLPRFNTIVSTLTLCSVGNLELVIEHLKQLLHNNGKLLIIEHIRSNHRFYGTFQDVIYPAWKIIGDGCHINRKIDVALKKEFYPIYEEYFFAGVDFYLAKMRKSN